MYDIWDNYSVSIVCLVAVIFCLWQTWYLKKDFFVPANVYVFAQCLTLGIAYIKFDPAMTDFTSKTWMVWGGALFSFVLGSVVYYLVNPRDHHSKVDTDVASIYNWRLHFIFSIVLMLAYFVGVALMIKKVGTLIILTDNISKWVSSDVDYGAFTSTAVASSPLVVLFFMVASFKSVNPYRGIRIFSVVMSFIIIALTVCVYPSRTSLFLSLGFILILFNNLKARIPIRVIVGALLVAVVLFVAVALFRSQYGTNSLQGMVAKQAMSIPYRYVANNYWNLDYMLNSPPDDERHPFTYGIDALNGMFEYTTIPGAIRKSMGWDGMFNESVNKVPAYNTTGYLWEVYKDWGIAGTVLFPFFVSLFMTFLYERMKEARSPGLWMLFTIFLYYVGWWFFLAGYKFGMFWLWVYLVIALTKICEQKKVEHAH
ncbi:O-antigen polymerase [Fibrobacter sp. UWR2]|uniref:O-antigen polymerase n=1 Tax=Fibrobacter sp. UWR2 TaxID=1964352 RepID=UPI000B527066|nr:O-antigen polymerase [Fibrobacter sp. UWR2]OWU98108.1 hypothetical protein B7994_13670 [Fibrobacter sp. UWR2]